MRFYRVGSALSNNYEVKWFGSETEARKHKRLMTDARGATGVTLTPMDVETDKKSLLEFLNEHQVI